MKKKNILVLVLILIVLIGTGIGGAFLIKNQMEQKVYKEKMEEGRKYFSRMKYEEAVAAFEFALKKNPEDEDVYVSIYRVRAAQGERELAIEILQRGFRETKSKRLSDLLARYVEKTNIEVDNSGEVTELPVVIDGDDKSVNLNLAIIQKLERYNYSSYQKEFGRYISNDMQGSSLKMVHGKIQAAFVYQDMAGEKKSINGAQKVPNDTAKPAYIQLQNIGLLFRNFESGVTFARLQEIVGSKVTCAYNNEAGCYADSFHYGNCEIQIECEENGDIVKTSAWNKIVPPRGSEEGEKISVEGVIINAVTGDGLAGASLKFKPKDRSQNTEDTVTDRTGSFEVKLEPGTYEAEVSCNGFITDSFELEVEKETPISGINFPLSPILSSGEIRIVLTWNSYPTDLDSHLSGTSVSGQRVNIYYGHRDANDGNQKIVSLDVDEMGGFGPETTTVYMDGEYRFWVEDFTHSGSIGSSGAQVKVYFGDGGAPQIFNVPAGEGNTWDVFTIKDGAIHSVNTITE